MNCSLSLSNLSFPFLISFKMRELRRVGKTQQLSVSSLHPPPLRQGFSLKALAVLELSQWTRLPSNSQNCLLWPPGYQDKRCPPLPPRYFTVFMCSKLVRITITDILMYLSTCQKPVQHLKVSCCKPPAACMYLYKFLFCIKNCLAKFSTDTFNLFQH